MQTADVTIIGGGIVGLATAWQITQSHPGKRVVVLEKESKLAAHQTGRNSGVLHSGMYYRPGSLRAANCHTGRAAMVEFCQREGIAHDVCGKVIVALNETELPALERIFGRGQQNGVRCEMIGQERLHELEPHVNGIQAIHVPEAGIVDYSAVTERLAELVRQADGEVITNTRVTGIRQNGERVIVESTGNAIESQCVINCTGLHSDRVAKLSGAKPDDLIVPFRGEYFELKPEAEHLCRTLIYPVPDTRFPFLGVHFTRMVGGGVECGPNAVLAFAREGYGKLNVNPRDLFETLTYIGFIRMATKFWRTGINEMWRSFSKAAFVKALQRLIPEIRSEHLTVAPSGIRAQALGRDGSLIDDFVILEHDRVVNVCNAPSPAATSALNVGRLVAEKASTRIS